ncbi:putative RING finger protein YBR062C [Talaromyces islandicus]|uniref:Putative RING finger protein YBR062C n=1 Tax=Talaromyces islandicus TaxID=28573 RepID=A0A0U1LMK9_TALIS|nr:putative RING finger protein YBR062C [Talaromyces islandicus]
MATYEVEHNTTDPRITNQTRPRRPDLSTFFSTLSEITPNPSETRTREHAVPVPGDVSAAFRSLAEAFDVMRREHDIGGAGAGGEETQGEDHHGAALIDQMIEALVQGAELPPREVEGVNEEFCDSLDRVPRSALKASQSCPICSNPFLDDPYPLVVRLPCHTTHLFDLECVRPWLRLRGTCPLDRTDFGKKQREKELERRKEQEKRRAAADDEEDDLDGMYG